MNRLSHRQPSLTVESLESLESHKDRVKNAKSDLGELIESLDERIDFLTDSNASDLQRLKEQRLSMEKCLQISTNFSDYVTVLEAKQKENDRVPGLSDATPCPDQCGKGNFSTINNYSTGDAVMFMISTDKRVIHGSNNALGWRSRYLTGHVNDASVQQISKDFAFMNTGNYENEVSSIQSNTFTADDEQPSHPGEDYYMRYGPGSMLSKGA